MKKKHGISMVEIVVAITIFTLIIIIGNSVVHSGSLVLDKSKREYDIQSSMRVAYENITEGIKSATAIFLMPETSFREDNFTKGWNYLGILEANGKREIVLITYDNTTGSHDKKVLVEAELEYEYFLEFRKNTEKHDDKQVQFILQAYKDGEREETYIDLSAEAEAFNTLQVVNWASDSNISTAMAFQLRDRSETVIGRMVFIIDRSDSMKYAMGGQNVPITNDSERRINIMKKAATKFITDFQGETVEIGMISFANDADAPTGAPYNGEYKFLPLETYMGDLIAGINGLSHDGATNTGDALRRVRYLFKDAESNPGVSYKNYVILLVDGDSTYGTINRDTAVQITTPEGNIEFLFEYYHGRGQHAESSNPELMPYGEGGFFGPVGGGYTLEAGQKLIGEVNVKPYVIALSSDVGTDGLTNVKNALGITDPSQILRVLEEAELASAFNSIKEEILNEMWYINGPKL